MRPRYFPLFDSLRGVAAMSVLTFHVVLLTPRIGIGPVGRSAAVLGNVGVELFFVISGFLLYRPFVAARVDGRPPQPLRVFFRRRALRILPAYWVILTIQAIYPGVHGPFSGDFWRYYGFLQLYDSDTVSLGMPVAWSLCVEVTFYLALPVWAWALRRVRLGGARGGWQRAELAALALAAAGGFAVQLLMVHHRGLETLAQTLVGQAPYFAVGMALAVLSVASSHRTGEHPAVTFVRRRPEACWLGAIAAWAALAVLVPDGGIFGAIRRTDLLGVGGIAATTALQMAFVALVALPAVFGDGDGGVPRRVLAWRPVAWIGMVSYSLYLWHLPIAELLGLDRLSAQYSASGLDLVHHVGGVEPALALWPLTLVAALALSAVTFYAVELPFIRRAGSQTRALPAAKEW
jgi:peptidoglycan/LPS O-acetylase OafA/YrhL